MQKVVLNLKKVGIVTLYHKNYNYGGLLQAYAMQKVLSHQGCSSELITIQYNKKKYILKRFKDMGCIKVIKNIKKRFLFKMKLKDPKFYEVCKIEERINKFEDFIQFISHSKLYTSQTITQIEKEYDMFFCGSDQIWNPGWWIEEYFLSFVKFSPKIAYAASIGRNNLNPKERAYVSEKLESFQAISVREIQAKELLESFIDKPISLVLDPTLLLSQAEWDEISIYPKMDRPYAFVYMVGNESQYKGHIEELCKTLNIAMVTIPHAKFMYDESDELYGEIKLGEVGPREWLGLMKNASYVFTDSFHGTVFSIINHKQFWCFERDNPTDKASENSRLYSFMKLTSLENRILRPSMLKDFSVSSSEIDYLSVENKLDLYKKDSLDFIQSVL